VGRGLLQSCDAKEMLGYQHSGFSVDEITLTPLQLIRRILEQIGVDSEPPHISPARGPPLWGDCDAQTDDGVYIEPHWDLAAQPAPGYEVDQRVNW
jgi:hypothetical protein